MNVDQIAMTNCIFRSKCLARMVDTTSVTTIVRFYGEHTKKVFFRMKTKPLTCDSAAASQVINMSNLKSCWGWLPIEFERDSF
jgi:hypothetical protein